MEEGLTVGEVAAKTALTAYTLRRYEQVGLLDPVPRDHAGLRSGAACSPARSGPRRASTAATTG